MREVVMGRKVLFVLVALAMMVAACGDDSSESTTTTAGGTTTTAGGTTTTAGPTTTAIETTTTAAALRDEILIVPNPSAVNWYNVCAASGQGFFAEQGLNITVEALDGSGPTLQAMAAGQAIFGAPGPIPLLAASERGEQFVGIFNHYATTVFGLVVKSDSGITTAADLAGEVVGVGTAEGAEVGWARGILLEAGLTEGTDYTFLPVGDGGQATAAFERGEIVAYAAGVPDIGIMEARGLTLTDITPDSYKKFYGNMYAVAQSTIDSDPAVVQAFVNAVTQGSAFGHDPANFEAVLDDCAVQNPEEGNERELAAAILRVVLVHTTPLAGDYGYYDMAGWEFIQQVALDGGSIAAAQDLTKIFTNQFVEAAYAAGFGG
jgi:NitT/TauT family transport system substrate-binding protein